MNAHLRYWKSVVQAAEAELDAATTNSELKLAARRLLRARHLSRCWRPSARAAGPKPFLEQQTNR
jgi:hypothetical protein